MSKVNKETVKIGLRRRAAFMYCKRQFRHFLNSIDYLHLILISLAQRHKVHKESKLP